MKMKKILNILKIFLLPVFWEAAIIFSQLEDDENIRIFFYLIFVVVAAYCLYFRNFLKQFTVLIIVVLAELILMNYQSNITGYLNRIFDLKLSLRNMTDDFLICFFIQIPAFFISGIMAQKRKNTNESNDTF